MKGLHVVGVSHAYEDNQVLNTVSLMIPAGEVVCLLGPSGCGKSTALRIAAGLEELQDGVVRIAGEVVADGDTQSPPEDRNVGLVFQDRQGVSLICRTNYPSMQGVINFLMLECCSLDSEKGA